MPLMIRQNHNLVSKVKIDCEWNGQMHLLSNGKLVEMDTLSLVWPSMDMEKNVFFKTELQRRDVIETELVPPRWYFLPFECKTKLSESDFLWCFVLGTSHFLWNMLKIFWCVFCCLHVSFSFDSGLFLSCVCVFWGDQCTVKSAGANVGSLACPSNYPSLSGLTKVSGDFYLYYTCCK